MYGLIIKKKWLDLIMSGKKTLEIRGCRTSHVGEEIALLESGSQKIRGFCTIKEVMALDKGKWEAHRDRHCVNVPWENLIKRYKTPYAWHLSAITPKDGLAYEHPKGAVVWVNLDHVSVFKEINDLLNDNTELYTFHNNHLEVIQNGDPARIIIEKSQAINSLFFPKNIEAKD